MLPYALAVLGLDERLGAAQVEALSPLVAQEYQSAAQEAFDQLDLTSSYFYSWS